MRALGRALIAALLVGCTSPKSGPTRPGAINHIVFFKLADPSDADELIADCGRRLRAIPGVTAYSAGRHFDMGRSNVDSDYDVGVLVAFDSKQDYQGYLGHPDHLALVEQWRSRWTWIRIYDVGNDPRK